MVFIKYLQYPLLQCDWYFVEVYTSDRTGYVLKKITITITLTSEFTIIHNPA